MANLVRAGFTGCHPGLAFDRFVDTWLDGWSTKAKGDRQPKKDFFSKIARLKPKDADALLGAACERRKAMFGTLRSVEWKIETKRLSTNWRLVTGLGISHPFEVGFVFDRLCGVPYLPGSSVKGAARAWAQSQTWSPNEMDRIFGPEGQPARGQVVFFDAYPTLWPALEVDILNPHYRDYYENGDPPGDWLSPQPVFFLTVAPGQEFDFTVAATPGSPPALATRAMEAVVGAATNFGLGGKSAVGYGYFA